jgi:hypothetical protein
VPPYFGVPPRFVENFTLSPISGFRSHLSDSGRDLLGDAQQVGIPINSSLRIDG